MNQEESNQNINDNLVSNSHAHPNNMLQSVDFDKIKLDLHGVFSSFLSNNNPHDNSLS